MKKLLVSLILALTCVAMTFMACEKKPTGNTGSPATLEDAKTLIKAMYINEDAETPMSYERVAQVTLNGTDKKPYVFPVEWSVNVTTEGATEDLITVAKSEDGNSYQIKIFDEPTKDYAYTLTATIKNYEGDATETFTFNHTIPLFTISSYNEFIKKADQRYVGVEGVITGIVSKKQGNSLNGLFIQDAKNEGGFYAYNMDNDPLVENFVSATDATKKVALAVGMSVQVKGKKVTYNGTYEIEKPSVKILKEEATAVTPVDYTEAYIEAAKAGQKGLEDKSLVGKQAMLVKLRGVEITKQGDNGYYKFKLAGMESYVRISSSACPLSKDDQAKFKKLHTDNFGYTADVEGLVTVYNNAFYLTPVTANAFTNLALPVREPADQIAFEKEVLEVPQSFDEDGSYTLYSAGKAYKDVAISWALDKEYTGITLKDNKLTFALQAQAQTITLTATLTCGTAEAQTKTFTVTIEAAESKIAEKITAPTEGTYKIYLYQANLKKNLYFAGSMSGNFFATTNRAVKGADVVLAKSGEGYTMSVKGKFIELELNSKKTGAVVVLSDKSSGTWAWNEELKLFTWTLTAGTFYLGTYNTFNTISASKVDFITGDNSSKIGVSQFPAYLCTTREATDEEKLAAIIAQMSTEVTADFDLDATATWVVKSGSAIVIESGKAMVTRPAAADGDATVVLTATLNGASKEVTITVKALPAPDETEEDIVNAAFALAEGESLPDTKSLTGVIVDIVTPYSTQFSNITVNIKLYEKVIQCFRLKGEGANLLVIGDKIKVTGTIKNHNGTVEFDAGCTFELVHRHTWDEGSVTKEANCTEKGTKVYNCTTCSETKTEEIPAIGHKDENADGKCDACGADMPSEISLAATFTLGKNIEGADIIHGDGDKSTTYTETAGNYTLKITNGTNLYTGANDAKGNGCLKLGTSKVAGSFSFTVDGTVKKVKVYVAAYKKNSASVNGTKLTKLSNNGEYDVIEIDTSTNKTVTIEVTSGYRAMVNTIEFYA